MSRLISSLDQLKPNPNWAKLQLFNRRDWWRYRFWDVVDNVNERVEPSDAGEDIYVGLDDLDSGNLHLVELAATCGPLDIYGSQPAILRWPETM